MAGAKARLSELIDRALTDSAQTITRNGQKTVVVVSVEEWERKLKRHGTLADTFAASPLRDSGIEIERARDTPRGVAL